MNKKIESKIQSVKKFWDDKKGTIAVVASVTTVAGVAIARASAKSTQEFVKEQGLETEYYEFLTGETYPGEES